MESATPKLSRIYAALVDEARAQVAAGRSPDWPAVEARIRAAGDGERSREPAAVAEAERRALQQLDRVRSVQRARVLVSREPAQPPVRAGSPGPRGRSALRTRPTITGNMDVRRDGSEETLTLTWDVAARVVEWEVRISERPDARSGYVVLETQTLPGTASTVDVPLTERPRRVHLLGRGRDGRLVQRALISGLTSAAWSDRWERRASAS